MPINVKRLHEVRAAILEKPERLLMESWINKNDHQAPCGTAACIGGHAVLIHTQHKLKLDWVAAGEATAGNTIESRARRILGLTIAQSYRLFYLDSWPRRFRNKYEEAFSRENKSKVAAARINHFIKTKGKE